MSNAALKERTLALVQRDREQSRLSVTNNARPISTASSGTYLYEILTGGNEAGVTVNERTAMCVSAVSACVSLIGGAIASMPFHIYKRDDQGNSRRVDSELWWLFNESPFTTWLASSAWEFAIMSVLLQGDGFMRIHRASAYSPKIIGFEPIHPQCVEVTRANGRNIYRVNYVDQPAKILDQDDMLHFPGIGYDGIRSLTPIQSFLKTPAGIALAADSFASSFFKNGARPDFAITTPGNLKDDAVNQLRETWASRHQGVSNAHLPAILTGGMDVKSLTMTSEDAQLLATRQFQVEDVCRSFGVPPFMIGHSEKTTSWGSGVEQMSIGFIKYTLQRHLTRIEQEINRKCWPVSRLAFGKFDTAGLERGDIKTRNEAYRIALGRAGEPGWLSVNDIRKAENLMPIDGEDELNKGNANAPAPAPADSKPQ